MAAIVVIGGGYGGMAAAARLAKLGHHVTLVESSPRLGGALERITQDEFAWDAGPDRTLLPAVARDLFRKSGRPLEKELSLEHLDIVREHRFADESSLVLPSSSLERQTEAVEALGQGLGEAWGAYVGAYAQTWELLRREYLERPWDPALADRATSAVLFPRETLHKRVRRALRDPRLRQVATYAALAEGHDPRQVPSWVGVSAYLEQRFGVWRVPEVDGGMAALGEALTRRLATRRVDVRLGVRATDVVMRAGVVRAVAIGGADGNGETDGKVDGEIDADHVVCAIDPRRLPSLAPHVASTVPAVPAPTAFLGLVDDDLPDIASETVVHAKELAITITTGGRAPEGHRAWRLSARGRLHDDLVEALSREGIDLRKKVVRRITLSPREQVERWSGSPWGVLWQGRGTVRARLGPRTPLGGVYAVGAHATPGTGLPFTGLSAALVAQEIGPA